MVSPGMVAYPPFSLFTPDVSGWPKARQDSGADQAGAGCVCFLGKNNTPESHPGLGQGVDSGGKESQKL